MADQERTEQPTPKRLREARRKGQVPRSRELNTTSVMLAGSAGLAGLAGQLVESVSEIMRQGLSYERAALTDPHYLLASFGAAIEDGLRALLPFFLIVLAAAIVAPALLGGWSFSTQAIAFRAEKLNPLKGLKRIFALRGLVELAKALAKFLLVATVAVFLLWSLADEFLALGRQPVLEGLASAGRLWLTALLWLSSVLLLIAAIDVPFQLWEHRRGLRMTRQEIRDEYRDTEGKPEVKSRIRSMQQELARRRMMEEVPQADVVVTNPTHYAVALRYEETRMRAPRVVAKGTDLVAARIRQVAAAHDVALFAAPPLARALHASTELGAEIPRGLYVAVAQVLGYVYQLRQAAAVGMPPPEPPCPEVDEQELTADPGAGE